MARYRPPRTPTAPARHPGWRRIVTRTGALVGAFVLLAGVLVSVLPAAARRPAGPQARLGVYVCDSYRTDELADTALGRPTTDVEVPTTLGAALKAHGGRLTRRSLTLPPSGARRAPVTYHRGDHCGSEAAELKVFVWDAGRTGEPSVVYPTAEPTMALGTANQTVVLALVAPTTPAASIQPPGAGPAPFTP